MCGLISFSYIPCRVLTLIRKTSSLTKHKIECTKEQSFGRKRGGKEKRSIRRIQMGKSAKQNHAKQSDPCQGWALTRWCYSSSLYLLFLFLCLSLYHENWISGFQWHTGKLSQHQGLFENLFTIKCSNRRSRKFNSKLSLSFKSSEFLERLIPIKAFLSIVFDQFTITNVKACTKCIRKLVQLSQLTK